jgi:hypothetical protein
MENNREYTFTEVLGNFKSSIVYLLRNWKLFALVIAISFVLGFFYRLNSGDTYKSSLSFVSENNGSDKLGGYASLASQFGIDLGQGGGGAFEGDNLLQFFKSRKLIELTLLSKMSTSNKLLLEEYFSKSNLKAKVEKLITEGKVDFKKNLEVPNRTRDSVLAICYKQIIENYLTVERPDRKLNFIYLEVVNKSEQFCKEFSEKLTDNAVKYYTEYKTKRATQNVNLLQGQADSLKRLLDGNITVAAEINDLNLNPLRQILKTSSQKKQIDIQANTAMYIEVLKQLALAKITLSKETPLVQIIDNPQYPLKKVNFGKLVTGLIFSIVASLFLVVLLLLKKATKKE